MMTKAQEEKNLYIRQGIITIEEDFSSLDSNNIWDDFQMFNIGVTDVPENYGIIFYRISEDRPIVNKTVGACYWVKYDKKEDNVAPGNFDIENQRRITILSSTQSQSFISYSTMYLKDGWLRQLRYNTEWHYTKGDKKMYAKLQNGFLRSAPKTITLDGKTINNPYPEELEQLGYKPVVYTDMPTEVTEGKHWESEWTEEENAIRQVWTLVDDPVYPEPELSAEDALNIIMGVVQ